MSWNCSAYHNRRLLFKQVLKRSLVTQLQSHVELKHTIVYRLADILKKDRAESFPAYITLKDDFCITIKMLESGVINHELLHFLCCLFSPSEFSILSGY